MLMFISIWDVMIRTEFIEFMDFSGLQLKHGQALQLRDHIVASCPGAQGAQGAQGSMGTAGAKGKDADGKVTGKYGTSPKWW